MQVDVAPLQVDVARCGKALCITTAFIFAAHLEQEAVHNAAALFCRYNPVQQRSGS